MNQATPETKRLLILGSTGSIGKSAIDVVRNLGDRARVVGLGAGRNWKLLVEQARALHPEFVILADAESAARAEEALRGESIQILTGRDAMVDAARRDDIDVVVCAVVGAIGLWPTVAAAETGKRIALANKESMIMAGAILRDICAQTGAVILPVDSEHSAVFQAMHGGDRKEVRRVIITGSGGPFRNASIEDIRRATPEQAVSHPTWSMGRKISIDSASMMNKALEIIEARWLFDVPREAIDVLIHPQSIVHSLVEFRDGSLLAQLSVPDMRLPIQYALTYPDRLHGCIPALDLASLGTLTFEAPDLEKFPALRLGFWAAEAGKTLGTVLNAANEVAVDRFLQRRISFTDIAKITEQTMRAHTMIDNPTLNDIWRADEWARGEAASCC